MYIKAMYSCGEAGDDNTNSNAYNIQYSMTVCLYDNTMKEEILEFSEHDLGVS